MALETQRSAAVPTGPDAATRHLEEQAATAALYVKKHTGQSQSKTGHEFLDSNHRLSSAGAATSLKYANPQDLPSFPSSGLKMSDSAAGAAASLGWANKKQFTHWKPDPSASASAAAMRAKDYKMAPLWQPEQSSHGAKAALMAHKGSPKVDTWQPETSTWGNSAALTAFKRYGAGGLSPVLDYGYTGPGRRGSQLAASGAMTNGRKRAESTPVVMTSKVETYPDERNATHNALRAAASASRGQKRPGGAIPYTSMSREMYTSHPPVAPEVEEADRQNTLHASAVAMARSMYTKQQKQYEATSETPRGPHTRRLSSSSSGDEVQPMRFGNLQEAAQKLAQERLAKLHDEHAQNREYRDYYTPQSPSTSRLGRGLTRRRAASDLGVSNDKEQSNRIRAQMSQFSSNVSQVDAKKRQQDRDALIAAAQRNVTKQLHGMDEKVFADTGKVPPSLLSEWEVKAHAAAQEKSDTRMENYGKVHVGGGKFVNQSEIDEVAQRNVQPVLDDIQEKAEAEKERQAAVKAEQETEARRAAEKKARDRESKELNRKLKHEEKEAEKARKSEEKHARKEAKERRKSAKYEPSGAEQGATTVAATGFAGRQEEQNVVQPTDVTGEQLATEPAPGKAVVTEHFGTEPTIAQPIISEPVVAQPVVHEPVIARPVTPERPINRPVVTEPSGATGGATGLLHIGDTPPRAAPRPPVAREPESAPIHTAMEDEASLRMREVAARATADDGAPNGKVKKWLNRLSRRLSRGSEQPLEKEKAREEGFVGGAALASVSANNSTASLERPGSVRDVALAGKVRGEEPVSLRGAIVAGPSDHCTVEETIRQHTVGKRPQTADDEFHEARDNFDDSHITPPTFPVAKEDSPVRDSRFIEEI